MPTSYVRLKNQTDGVVLDGSSVVSNTQADQSSNVLLPVYSSPLAVPTAEKTISRQVAQDTTETHGTNVEYIELQVEVSDEGDRITRSPISTSTMIMR